MAVHSGKRFVKVVSPLSVLAIGLVCSCGGLASLFIGNFFPDDLITPPFRPVFFWIGVYLLAVGTPSLAVFVHHVISPPRDIDDLPSISFESLLGWFIGLSSTLGPMGAGILLFLRGGDQTAPGILLFVLGLMLLFIALPVALILRATPTPAGPAKSTGGKNGQPRK